MNKNADDHPTDNPDPTADKDRLRINRRSDRRHKVVVGDEPDISRHDQSITSREDAAHSREEAALLREDAADLREDAADLREDTADLREDAANLREDAAHLREDAADLREDTANLREGAAYLREDAAYLREEAVISREREVCDLEATQAASEDHMAMLQESNSRLVIAIMEAKQLAEQVDMATAQLEIAKRAAEEANLAKSNFISNMSHELRTPLNAILGFAQLLEMGSPAPTDEQHVRLQQITKAGWYLLELVNEILDLAVIESGKLTLSKEPISIIEIMRECEAMIEPQAQQYGIHISFQPFDTQWHANADSTRLQQVLINLLSNAIKYNREHGTVEVTCTLSDTEHIRISVKDTGEGLSPDKLAHLFQPFNRLGQETGTKEGTGIGLVVSQQLVELMGGTIGVKSTIGVGSEFWIELLRDDMPQPVVTNTKPVALALQASEGMIQHTLLYVEDNSANLMLVEQIVEDIPNVRMLSAMNGSHGIALARTHLPDVILMDINLPDINGIEALKILQSDPLMKHIPVIALSANAMRHDIEKALAAGFFRYLTKPIKVGEFINVLNMSLEHVKISGTRHNT